MEQYSDRADIWIKKKKHQRSDAGRVCRRVARQSKDIKEAVERLMLAAIFDDLENAQDAVPSIKVAAVKR